MKTSRRVLVVVMDGVGLRESRFGNAVKLAHTPYLNYLSTSSLSTSLNAHGTYVGLPSDNDIGNSEVGHNTLGGGRVFTQGASLVKQAIENKSLFEGKVWKKMLARCLENNKTLHFLGLLSDGNVHSHENHLHSMLIEAVQSGIKKIRIHALLDGRDVGEKTAEIYIERLEMLLNKLRAKGCDVEVASGGGRMTITMDRYQADWSMVERGWNIHVHGSGPIFPNITSAINEFRKDSQLTDQNLPGFCIAENGNPIGKIHSGDSVILFNFRGDRAMEISQAFESTNFPHFERNLPQDVFFAGMMEYDGDLNIPKNYLVDPPQINNTLSEYLIDHKVTQFACSETQKFGHVTYFWNGNKSGYLNKKLEEYVEIPSDLCSFDERPWMKAREITDETIKRLQSKSFCFGRINFANGDMVGHTGHLDASIVAVSTVDLMVGRMMEACKKYDTLLVVTADHGNCDEMFDAKEDSYPTWEEDASPYLRPRPKTSHTLANVPFYIYDPNRIYGNHRLLGPGKGSLANLANTCIEMLGLPQVKDFAPSLLLKS